MKKNPLFSIITVVYNGEELIEKTIQSVVGQTFRSVEYIVIDGGSNDNTLSIINKYADNIAYTESSKDEGVYDAMNKAISHVNGKWVLFMNAGDIFIAQDTLARVADSISCEDELDLVYGDVVLGDKQKTLSKAKEFDYIKFGMPFCHQSVFVRSNIFQTHKFNCLYKVCADFDFFLRLYNDKINKYKKLNFPITIFDVGGISYKHNVFYGYYEIVKAQYGFSLITGYHFFRSRYKTLRAVVKRKLLMLFTTHSKT